MQAAALFLTGPTAAGKTAASLALAEALNAEIVSVDSALVYRRLDIGSAKPQKAERGDIAHHLIDIREPWETYSAAAFCDDALACMNDIARRGKRVLFVGGTMLYWRALVVGMANLPDADPDLRAELGSRIESEGLDTLHAELAEIDPQAASRIHPNDPQRLVRALEVWKLTGQRLSDMQRDTQPAYAGRWRVYALMPERRAWLHERIARRLELMQSLGFVDEVSALLAEPQVHAELPALKSVGYRQVVEFLEQRCASWMPEATAATRQLAKRQLTWLRSMDNVKAIPCDTLTANAMEKRLVESALRWLDA